MTGKDSLPVWKAQPRKTSLEASMTSYTFSVAIRYLPSTYSLKKRFSLVPSMYQRESLSVGRTVECCRP